MNSEIASIAKLSPVTLVKAEKSKDDRLTLDIKGQDLVPGQAYRSENIPSIEANSLQQDETNKADKPSIHLMQKAAQQGNELLQAVNRSLQFKVDDSTDELVVKIVDNESGEVVRQIPSEEMLTFIKRMQDLDGGQGSVLHIRA